MTTTTAAERRKMRVAKVLEHRMKKQLSLSAVKAEEDTVVTRRNTATGTRPKGLDAQEIKRERRIRNRESAIRYRQRRQMELDECTMKITDLQRENELLRERLSKYENLNAPTERRITMNPAIF